MPAPGEYIADDTALLELIENTLPTVRAHLDRQEFHKAIEAIIALSNAANLYIDEQGPWTLRKTDTARMNTVLYVLCEAIRNLGLLLQPFIPDSATKILDAVGVGGAQRDFRHYGLASRLSTLVALPAPQPIFPRLETK